ncbi:MC081R [Molluscum contagiosum virus subtype 1]|uniref:MC081R n=3 Tax=Molluscum contagiosum virus TaxID=10279 RepID=A0A7G5AX82_MCV1|nr:MC081R [Molluscum contagiosum virus subtype 1]AZT86327.1 MC081R [Molluscum contagiosum virus]AAC55209.1 MC081R [Molluscum contagiosum virus subtype 1]AQY16830.1 MC081 [Molluscum contagiosum virus subtype 1]AQY17188.1 MC081 [Molluscum contagiosum virus subtype 1]AYO87541.1 MC081 [Molluscum contagiosum virus subtype 1]
MDLKTLVITHEDYGTKAVSVDGASSALDLRERVKVAFQVLGEIELFVHPCPLRSRVLDSDALPVEEPAHAAFFVALGAPRAPGMLRTLVVGAPGARSAQKARGSRGARCQL